MAITDLISRIVKTCTLSVPTRLWDICSQSYALNFNWKAKHSFSPLTIIVLWVLQGYQTHTSNMERLWFEERRANAIRAQKDPPQDFPLASDRATLTQLLALLDPITTLNVRAQRGSANQVEVILSLYLLRLTVMDESAVCVLLPRLLFFFRVHELTPTVKKTRHLLAAAFQKTFFSRYTDRSIMRDTSYIPEAQMWLHTVFKNPDKDLTKIFESTTHS
ncbi:LOW QUALITY PROTEIN: hypothetical protein PHMEG_00035225 [Phytophthora megakarya]|uniref:Uncharacterized protein n=1 Tax=Phytophthora megakarya TaxID=4795 RepID=A0A225UPI4_9STRA|nr:LOW QUALITY PROTEIN: hypothetical protein PHMEG_00035225 [Phytophthora megakarya]